MMIASITVTKGGITRRMMRHRDRIVVRRDGEDGLIVGAPPSPHEVDRLCAHMGLPLRELAPMIEMLMRDEEQGEGPRPAA
jgi:hypothetical protein